MYHPACFRRLIYKDKELRKERIKSEETDRVSKISAEALFFDHLRNVDERLTGLMQTPEFA